MKSDKRTLYTVGKSVKEVNSIEDPLEFGLAVRNKSKSLQRSVSYLYFIYEGA